jgi:hypothetical protein
VNLALGNVRLVLGNGQQRAVVNRFDKAVSQSVERRPQRPDIFRNSTSAPKPGSQFAVRPLKGPPLKLRRLENRTSRHA